MARAGRPSPTTGSSGPRLDFDETLARHAQASGAKILERTNVTGPVLDERTGRIVGVTARPVDDQGRRAGDEVTYRAPLVVAADGVSARLALSLGMPSGTTARWASPSAPTTRARATTTTGWSRWLELWDGEPDRSQLLPGYGWVFGVGDGTSNVGLGHPQLLGGLRQRRLPATCSRAGWRRCRRSGASTEENMTEPIRGAALPMGFNRTPHYTRGLLLVGDAGGMVNPFNGEGIAYAMESGRIAADVVAQALARPDDAAARAGAAGLPAAAEGRPGRLLHARPGVRAADRQPAGDEAGDQVRPAAARR